MTTNKLIMLQYLYKREEFVMRKGVYPGSFDPPTLAHLDIIKRASELVDELHVVIAQNPRKVFSFSVEAREIMLQKMTKDIPNVRIGHTSDLVVRYAQENGLKVLFRGLRNIADYEAEYQLFQFNKNLNNEVETVYLFPSTRNGFVSSSSIKELVYHHADISLYVHEDIINDVIKGLPKK